MGVVYFESGMAESCLAMMNNELRVFMSGVFPRKV
jgi:hypothetical protein